MVAEGLVELGEVGGAPAGPFAVAVLEAAAGAHAVIGAGIDVVLVEGVGGIVAVHGGEGEPVGHDPDELEVAGQAFTVSLGVVVAFAVQHVGGVLGPPDTAAVAVGTDLAVHEDVLAGGVPLAVLVLFHHVRNIPRHGIVGILQGTPGRGALVVGLRVVETHRHGQTVRERNRQVHAGGGLLEVGVDEGTLFIVVVRAHEVADLAGLARRGSVVVLHHAQLEVVVHPVEVLLQQALGIGEVEQGGGEHALRIVVELLGVHRTEGAHQGLLDTAVGLEFHGGVVLGTALGRDDDDTAGGGRTVQGGGGSVLQDGDGLDVVGVEGTAGDAVHHIERTRARGDGTGTADADVGVVTRLAGAVHDHDAGDLALQHVTHVVGAHVAEFLTAHGDHGAGEFRFLLGRVTQDHDFVEGLGVGTEGYVDDRAAVDRLRHADITQGGERNRGVRRRLDHEFTVEVGNGSATAGKQDTRSDERLAVRGVRYLARDGDRLGRCRDREREGRDGCKQVGIDFSHGETYWLLLN